MRLAPMLIETAMVTLVASQRTHLLLELNIHADPELSQIHCEHNLPVVPSAQSLHVAGSIPLSPLI